MKQELVRVDVRAVLPLPAKGGCVVFVGNEDKVFTMEVDSHMGMAITMFIHGTQKERPLTHDLIGNIFTGFGIKVERAIINEMRNNTYFARLILKEENELGKKLVEIDSRPSDSIAIAIQQKAPIFCTRSLFDQVDDMSEILKQMGEQSESEFDADEDNEVEDEDEEEEED